MRRYFDIALTALAATVFAPVALWVIAVVVLFAFLIGLYILMILLVLTHHLAGVTGVVIVVLGTIAATAYGIYNFVESIRTSRFLKHLLPRLNAYKDLLARYDPDTLPEPHRDNVGYYQHKYADFLAANTRRLLNCDITLIEETGLNWETLYCPHQDCRCYGKPFTQRFPLPLQTR